MTADVEYQPGDVVNGHRLSDDGTHWIPVDQTQSAGADADAGQKKNWFARHKVLTALVGAGALFVAIGAVGSGGESSETSPSGATTTESGQDAGASAASGSSADKNAAAADESVAEEPVAEKPAAEKAVEEPVVEEPVVEEPVQETTPGQENALRAAENYLDTMAFSKQGLIDQLSSEYGDAYSVKDATWAVNQLDVDWNEQAVSAGKNYLDTMPFSRSGLIEQLSSPHGDQYTVQQATYAADKLGL